MTQDLKHDNELFGLEFEAEFNALSDEEQIAYLTKYSDWLRRETLIVEAAEECGVPVEAARQLLERLESLEAARSITSSAIN